MAGVKRMTGCSDEEANAPKSPRFAPTMAHLPSDVIRYIMCFLATTSRGVAVARSVCKTWSAALSISTLREESGLEAVNVHTVFDTDIFALLGERTRSLCTSTDTSFSVLPLASKRSPYLTHLTFYGKHKPSSFMRDNAFPWPELVLFRAPYSYIIDDSVIEKLARACGKLAVVDVRESDNLTDRSIVALAAACPALRVLDAYRCRKLTDASIDAVAAACGKLEKLHVRGCPLISREACVRFATARGADTLRCDHPIW